MDSAFLTYISLGLGAYALLAFLKMIIQFGLPNHPARFTAYLVSMCLVVYLTSKALTNVNVVSPWIWIKWSSIPMVAGSLALLLQTIMTIGSFSLIQQKIVSRLPVIASLLCFAFFPAYAGYFLVISVTAGCLFLLATANKSRYQKRLYLKMAFFLGLTGICRLTNIYWFYVMGECLLFFALFYFFLFEQSFGISSLIEQKVNE